VGQRITTGRVVCWATTSGAVTAVLLSTILTVSAASSYIGSLTVSYAVIAAIIAAPLGALCALVSLGMGLLARRLVRLLPVLGPLAPAGASTLIAFATGVATTAVLGYPLTGWFRVTAIVVTGLGALALGYWIVKCDSAQTKSKPPEPTPRMSLT